jgi:hypothetical protein
MNLSLVYQAVAAAVCVAISYGVNQHQKPVYDPSYPPQLYTEPQASLQLSYHGQTMTFPLMSMQIASHDVERLGRVYALRELAIRGTAPREQQSRIELYVDLARNAERDPRALAQVELTVARSGRFGARPSFVLVDGGQLRRVISGNLLLTEVTAMESDSHPGYRAAGRVELQLEGPGGVELITGRLEGRLASDAES